MLSTRRIRPKRLPAAAQVQAAIDALRSSRPVCPVANAMGRRAWGHFSSIKGLNTYFEIGPEFMALQVFELPAYVLQMESHPMVLQLVDRSAGKALTYTTDVVITCRDAAVVVEVKGDWLTKRKRSVMSVKRASNALHRGGMPYQLVLGSDLKDTPPDKGVQLLKRVRAVGAPRMRDVDATLWDPLDDETLSEAMQERWEDVQREYDALIERLMRRDPDEVVDFVRA